MFEEIKDIKHNYKEENEAYSTSDKCLKRLIEQEGGMDSFLVIDPKGIKIEDSYYNFHKGKVDPFVKPTKDWVSYDEALGYDLVIINSSYEEQKTNVTSYDYTSGYEVTVSTSTGNVTNVSSITSTGYSEDVTYETKNIHSAYWIKKVDKDKKQEIIKKEKEYIKYYPMIKDIEAYGNLVNVRKTSRFKGFIYNFIMFLNYLSIILSSLLSVGLFYGKETENSMMIELTLNLGLMEMLSKFSYLLIPLNVIIILGLIINIVYKKTFDRFSKESLTKHFVFFGIYVLYMVLSTIESVFNVETMNVYATLEIPYLLMYIISIVFVFIYLVQIFANINFKKINEQIANRHYLLANDNLKKIRGVQTWIKKNKLSHDIPKIINIIKN